MGSTCPELQRLPLGVRTRVHSRSFVFLLLRCMLTGNEEVTGWFGPWEDYQLELWGPLSLVVLCRRSTPHLHSHQDYPSYPVFRLDSCSHLLAGVLLRLLPTTLHSPQSGQSELSKIINLSISLYSLKLSSKLLIVIRIKPKCLPVALRDPALVLLLISIPLPLLLALP